jgi:uncharacterized protein YndB with AHSA1/START domain
VGSAPASASYPRAVPRYAATRMLLAPVEDVWGFLAEPYHLADWWPGISGVRPDRRGLAPGARWQVLGGEQPTLIRRPRAPRTLLVLDVVPMSRIAFRITGDRVDAELELHPAGEARTEAALAVDSPWPLGGARSLPRRALGRLYDLVQTAAE